MHYNAKHYLQLRLTINDRLTTQYQNRKTYFKTIFFINYRAKIEIQK